MVSPTEVSYTCIYESLCHVWLHGPWTIFFAQWPWPCGQCGRQPVFKTITWLLLSLEPSEPCLRNLHQHAPEPSGTCLPNLHQHAPEPSRICCDPPEPSGTCFRNLHQHLRHSAELSGTYTSTRREPSGTSGTFRNLPEPAPAARAGTHRSLSGLKTPLAYAVGEVKNMFKNQNHLKKTNKLTRYPQQLGRSWKVFVPEPSGTLSAMCTGQLSNFVCYLHRNHPELHGPSAPGSAIRNPPEPDHSRPHQASASEPSGTLSAMCTGQLSNFVCYLRRNHPELHGPSAPGPSELDRPSGTLQHLISHLRRNRPEPHQLFARNRLGRNPSEPFLQSAPEPSGTSSAFCPETLRNLISHLHRNPPEPCLLSAPEPSGTSSASCPGTVRNLISHLHRNPPEPHQQSAPEGSGTLRNLLRNLVLQLHRIAPELFWAKDPIASFAVAEK